MVAKDGSLYLLIGQDTLLKDAKIKKIKEPLLSKNLEHFNLDTLYGRELTLKLFQEKAVLLPVGAKRRIIIIRQAEAMKEEIKKFILKNFKAILQLFFKPLCGCAGGDDGWSG
jgi:DNA polymerase III delta subunit